MTCTNPDCGRWVRYDEATSGVRTDCPGCGGSLLLPPKDAVEMPRATARPYQIPIIAGASLAAACVLSVVLATAVSVPKTAGQAPVAAGATAAAKV